MPKYLAALVALPMLMNAQIKDDLIGTWKLLTAWSIRTNGERTPMYGEHPAGFLIYTREGRMMAILSDTTARRLSGDRSTSAVEERAEAFSKSLAYGGPFTVEGNTITHHVDIASYPNFVGTSQVRHATLEGDRLTLRVKRPDGTISGELQWQRVK